MNALIESITLPAGDAPGVVVYRLTVDGKEVRVKQPFRRGPPHYAAGEPVWGWDGGEPVTLMPSFDCAADGWRLHCFLVAGKIRLCPDSTVR
jgi:hypothetical protein